MLAVGAGHMEKNTLLAIMQLYNQIFIEVVTEKMDFKTINGKNFVINCGDHHISWQVFLACLEAFARELLYMYIIAAQKEGREPSAIDMYSRKNDIDNTNFNFYYDLVFNIMLALKCLRSGIRRNKSQFYVAGRQKAAYVMFFNKHDIYRTILRNDMKTRALAPDAVYEYMAQNESVSWCGNKFKGEKMSRFCYL